MPDTQIYRFFRDNGPGVEATFLFEKKIDPVLRPKVGDSISIDAILDRYTIIRIETPVEEELESATRITDNGMIRVTSDGRIRVTGGSRIPNTAGLSLVENNITANYFVTQSNNPNRIVSWTSNRFADDQTLKQLFR